MPISVDPPVIKPGVPRQVVDLEPLPKQPISVPLSQKLDISLNEFELSNLSAEIIYSDVSSDGVFEYRVVELPFEIANLLPLRNFCEAEWRSFGVCMRTGWENYGRRSWECAVLLFRRPIDEERANEFRSAELERYKMVRSTSSIDRIMIFPIWFFETHRVLDDSKLWAACDQGDLKEIMAAVADELQG